MDEEPPINKKLQKEKRKKYEKAKKQENEKSQIIICISIILAIVFIVQTVEQDYSNYINSQIVTAQVIGIEVLNNRHIYTTYQYNYVGKTYIAHKEQKPTKKLKIGNKSEIRINKSSPKTILDYDDIDTAIAMDALLILFFVLLVYAISLACCLFDNQKNI